MAGKKRGPNALSSASKTKKPRGGRAAAAAPTPSEELLRPILEQLSPAGQTQLLGVLSNSAFAPSDVRWRSAADIPDMTEESNIEVAVAAKEAVSSEETKSGQKPRGRAAARGGAGAVSPKAASSAAAKWSPKDLAPGHIALIRSEPDEGSGWLHPWSLALVDAVRKRQRVTITWLKPRGAKGDLLKGPWTAWLLPAVGTQPASVWGGTVPAATLDISVADDLAGGQLSSASQALLRERIKALEASAKE